MSDQVIDQTDSLNQSISSSSEMDGKYLTFWSDKQLFGVPIADVVQIVGLQEITQIPEFPSYAKGIINLRGSIIPLIDVRLRFGKTEAPYSERTCVIVTSIHGAEIGFIVDEVNEVTDIDDQDISEPPKMSNDSSNSFLTGVAKQEHHIVLLVDAAKILSGEVVDSLIGTEFEGEE